MSIFRRIASGIIGIVLFGAGFLKLMDPVGSSLVMEAYFRFLHLDFLVPLSKAGGVFFAFAEATVGAALLTGVRRRLTAIVTGILLTFFTVLTFVLWIANPDMECGCFGKAIPLTHFQSLMKNVILCVLWVTAFVPFRKAGTTYKIKYISFTVTVAVVAAFTVYSLISVPALDYTDFTISNVVAGSPDGYDQAALPFYDADGEYRDAMATRGRIMIVSVYDPDRLSDAQWTKISSFMDLSLRSGFRFLLLTASTPGDMALQISDRRLLRETYYADRRTLMTFNRANGGLTYLDEGQIIAKWSMTFYPDDESLDNMALDESSETMMKYSTAAGIGVQAVLVGLLAVMFLL